VLHECIANRDNEKTRLEKEVPSKINSLIDSVTGSGRQQNLLREGEENLSFLLQQLLFFFFYTKGIGSILLKLTFISGGLYSNSFPTQIPVSIKY
jgi:hypothetical protein